MDKTCILIVDDNPEIREIINVLLGGEGFEVSEAENGAQALTCLLYTSKNKGRKTNDSGCKI